MLSEAIKGWEPMENPPPKVLCGLKTPYYERSIGCVKAVVCPLDHPGEWFIQIFKKNKLVYESSQDRENCFLSLMDALFHASRRLDDLSKVYTE